MEKVTTLTPKKIDLSVDDLPEDIANQLSKPRDNEKRERLINIIRLLEQQEEEANINNIIIAYWRLHKEKLLRGSLVTTLSKLASDGHIKQAENKRGLYNSID